MIRSTITRLCLGFVDVDKKEKLSTGEMRREGGNQKVDIKRGLVPMLLSIIPRSSTR